MLDYDSDSDLKGYDKHKIFSQRGTFLALLPGDMLESTGDVPISMMDWKTKSGKRVFHATFAAEAQAAGDTSGIAHDVRAYWCDILYGHADWVEVTEFGEDHMKIKLYTDCKSLFDHPQEGRCGTR